MRFLLGFSIALIVAVGCDRGERPEALPSVETTPPVVELEPPESAADDRSPSRSLEDIQAKNEAMLAQLQREMDERQAREQAPRRELTIEEMIALASEAVVVVEVDDAMGSGFFVRPDIVVTNHHVVGKERLVTIKDEKGNRPARVLQTIESHDLALVEMYDPDPEQAILELGSVEDVRRGEEVYAIGSPYGLHETVTRGVVSGVRSTDAVTFIQTDTPLNPGNSGGPLLNKRGLVVGVNTAKLGNADRLGFSVAADHVVALVGGAQALEPLPIAESTRSDMVTRAFGDSVAGSASRAPGAPPLHNQLDQYMKVFAQRADEIDRDYARMMRECDIDGLSTRGSRPTVNLIISRGVSVRTPRCTSQYGTLSSRAYSLGEQVMSLVAEARRVGIDESTIAYARRAHRLDW